MCVAERRPTSEARWKLDMMACMAATLLALLLNYLASSEGNAADMFGRARNQPGATGIPELAEVWRQLGLLLADKPKIATQKNKKKTI